MWIFCECTRWHLWTLYCLKYCCHHCSVTFHSQPILTAYLFQNSLAVTVLLYLGWCAYSRPTRHTACGPHATPCSFFCGLRELTCRKFSKSIPYLLDCKPRLIKFFFSSCLRLKFKGGLRSRAAYIFLFYIFFIFSASSGFCDKLRIRCRIYRKCCIIRHSQPANAGCRLTRIPLYANSRTFTSNHTLIFVPTQIPKTHIDTGTVYAAYIQGRLTLNLSISCGLQSRAAYNQGRLTIE